MQAPVTRRLGKAGDAELVQQPLELPGGRARLGEARARLGVETVNGTPSRALVIADRAHVVWAVNLGCLGFHVWPYRAADPEHCDELRLDLDPQPGTDFEDVRLSLIHI